MVTLTKEIQNELLHAMDSYTEIARKLIHKLIVETNQPQIDMIKEGEYFLIENTDEETLSDNWYYDVHGEHCLFINEITGQKLEVFLGYKDNIETLDPYFFYNFLKTTDDLKHLSEYFKNPFNDMADFFDGLIRQNLMTKDLRKVK